jgi:glutathione S-transferase
MDELAVQQHALDGLCPDVASSKVHHRRGGVRAVRTRGRENISECFAYIEKLLADGRGWAIAEGYTVVDAYLLVFYYWGRSRISMDMGTLYPAWTRLSELVAERPAVQRALKAEGITIFEAK